MVPADMEKDSRLAGETSSCRAPGVLEEPWLLLGIEPMEDTVVDEWAMLAVS